MEVEYDEKGCKREPVIWSDVCLYVTEGNFKRSLFSWHRDNIFHLSFTFSMVHMCAAIDSSSVLHD